MSLIDDLRKFFVCSWQERGLVVEAFLLLGMMRAAILLLPFRRITGMLGLVQGCAATTLEAARLPKAVAIGWAVQAVAARTPWESTCLVQALTGLAMLGRRGIAATLFLGVGRSETEDDVMDAHAWLNCGDTVLTGAGGVERFAAVASFCRSSADSTPMTDNDRNTR